MSKTFIELGISEALSRGLSDLKITKPTEIQEKAIPILLSSKNDFIGLAKTGTGKTAAFGLPILDLIDTSVNQIQCVILVPTRELGQQIFKNLQEFSKYLPNTKSLLICGGTPIKPQIESLNQTNHIVIATPGRLIDLIKKNAINIKETPYLILDEADEMVTALKNGLDDIVAELPKQRRTFLFSATLTEPIKQLTQKYLSKNPTEISVNMEVSGNQSITHQYVVVEPEEKLNILTHFLSSKEGERIIIFCKTKAAVNKLAKNLAINRFSSGALHGSLTQPIRDRIMDQFRAGNIKILVATDVAARGIDIKEISCVINYHLPDVSETYVHRSGRTARAGKTGISLSVLQNDELPELEILKNTLGIPFSEYIKPNVNSIEENNTYLWAKQVFKTKPNHDVDSDIKNNIKTIFHHLTKDELIEKLIAFNILQNKSKK